MSVEFYVISREPTPSTPSHWTQPTHLVFLCFLFARSSLLHVIKRDVLGEMEGARQLCLGRNEPFFLCLYPFLPPFLGFLYPYGVMYSPGQVVLAPRSCSILPLPITYPQSLPASAARQPPTSMSKNFCPTMLRFGHELPRFHPLRKNQTLCRYVAPPLIPHPRTAAPQVSHVSSSRRSPQP
ncbi:hypothetical protein CABS01_05330 [Colletotrichum abscissum]|uniref:uncharacterized protein n=1 Tax=Colletotrichum abscissum TaxID=1671311 RepID=UPI0027D72CCC|nr:uncharacterized protein CABS01_05330 [Colletotrichum abscissum]KAK1523709.1 hypothetical protein CABS01_05330 [Colletotrichum abscissum]